MLLQVFIFFVHENRKKMGKKEKNKKKGKGAEKTAEKTQKKMKLKIKKATGEVSTNKPQ